MKLQVSELLVKIIEFVVESVLSIFFNSIFDCIEKTQNRKEKFNLCHLLLPSGPHKHKHRSQRVRRNPDCNLILEVLLRAFFI